MFGGAAFMGGGFQTATRSKGVGVQYSERALAYFARREVQPSAQRKARINAAMIAMESVWPKMTAFYVHAMDDEQGILLNWASDNYDLTASGTPDFVEDDGVYGDGGSLLDTNFNPSTAGDPNFLLNSCHIGIWSLTDLNNSSQFDFGNPNHRVNARSTSANTIRGALGTGTLANFGATSDSLGYIVLTRSGTTVTTYKDGVSVGTATSTASSFSNSNMTILGTPGFPSTRGQSVTHMGGHLTVDDIATIRSAMQGYFDGIAEDALMASAMKLGGAAMTLGGETMTLGGSYA